MNEITIFENPEFGKIRTADIDDQIYFCGSDVASALGYAYTADAIRTHCKGVVDLSTPSNGGNQLMKYIPESDVYRLVMRSKLPSAERFQDWVVSDVLPAIRRHGAYLTPAKLEEALLNPDVLIRLATNLKAEQEKSARLEARIEADSAKVRFAEAVTASSATIRIGELAKILKQNGYATGQTRLFAQLRAEGYLMKNAVGENIPTQKAMELGLFEIQESAIITGTGKEFITKTTRVTGKGQQYFIDRYAKRQSAQGGIA